MTRIPGWVEVEYILSNTQSPWEGSISIFDTVNGVTYQTPVSLPQQSRKAYRIAFYSTDGYKVTSTLESISGQKQDFVIPVVATSKERVCAYFGAHSDRLYKEIANCGTFVQSQSLAEIPEAPMVWDNIDVLILNGINTQNLSDKQREGMVAWVSSGGHLIVSGSLGLDLSLQSLPPILQIAKAGQINILKTIPEVVSGDVEIASSELQLTSNAEVLVEGASGVLAARQNIGKGMVDIIGWDIAQLDSMSWVEKLWSDDPIPATSISIFGQDNTSAGIAPAIFELQEIPNNHMPKLWLWLVVFVLYVLLLGPITGLIIKRIHNPTYAWVIIPGWIVLAILAMAAVLSGTYGNTFPLIHDIAFISVNGAHLPARVIQGTAVTAPQTKKLAWTTPGYIRPLWGQFSTTTWSYSGTPYPLTITNQSSLSKLNTGKPNGVITWGVEGVIDGPDLQAELAVSIDTQAPLVTGHLRSDVELEDVTLIWIGHAYQTLLLLEQVPAEDTVPVSRIFPTGSTYQEPMGIICDSASRSFSEPMIKPIQPPSREQAQDPRCYITAKAHSVPFPTSDIAGNYTGESCMIFTVPCPVQSTGSFTTRLSGYPSGTDGGWVDTEMDIVTPYPPTSTFIFQLPDHISINKVNTINISISAAFDSETLLLLENESILIALWDWQGEIWVHQPYQLVSSLKDYEIVLNAQDAEKFFNTQERNLKIQLIVPNDTYLQLKLPITIDGIW